MKGNSAKSFKLDATLKHHLSKKGLIEGLLMISQELNRSFRYFWKESVGFYLLKDDIHFARYKILLMIFLNHLISMVLDITVKIFKGFVIGVASFATIFH